MHMAICWIATFQTRAKAGSKRMKKYFSVIAAITILIAIGCAQTASKPEPVPAVSSTTQETAEPQLYTAYNIWRMGPHNMKCINYKYGNDILPAGTMVKNVDIGTDRTFIKQYITFQSVDDNRVYRILFTRSWHPGKSIEDYRNLMITTQSFDELTAGMTAEEIQAIKLGTIVNGMSKKAVLVAYGYPPEHRTASTFSNYWIYWRNKFRTFRVCFDKHDRTVACQ